MFRQNSVNNNTKVAVVTGANKGIGFAIVKQILMHHPNWIVYLTARDPVKGAEAVKLMKQEFKFNAKFHALDIESLESIRAFKSHIVKNHPRGIDAFVHNAAIVPKARKPRPQFDADQDYLLHQEEAEIFTYDKLTTRRMLKLNFFATQNVCNELFPLLTHEARVVFVSSRIGHLAYMNSEPKMQEKIKNTFTVDDTVKLMSAFMDTDPDDYVREGWLAKPPNTNVHSSYRLGDLYAFGMSKLGVTLLARAYQREFREKNFRVLVNACCPGLIHSESRKVTADLPADQGADTPYYLTDLSRESPHCGDFVAERKSIGHFTLSPSDLEYFLRMFL